jgi:hypothetical protein
MVGCFSLKITRKKIPIYLKNQNQRESPISRKHRMEGTIPNAIYLLSFSYFFVALYTAEKSSSPLSVSTERY